VYRLEFTRQAQKDAALIERAGLKPKALELLSILKANPYQNPPRYEKLQNETVQKPQFLNSNLECWMFRKAESLRNSIACFKTVCDSAQIIEF
jgi:hypothetical protein